MSLFEMALEALRKSRQWSGKQINQIRLFAAKVAAVESRGDPTAIQYGNGPGRGKYQFEMAAHGGSGSNSVAINRFGNFRYRHGAYLPLTNDDTAIVESEDPDFSELSEDAQDVLFLANCERHPKFPLANLVDGLLSHEDAWIRYHWAGPEKQVEERRKHWRRVNGLPA